MKKWIFFILLICVSTVFPAAETTLSGKVSDGLLLMREEEKLARDVYTFLYKSTGQQIFRNIASSEQTHMDQILRLLDFYGIPDPVSGFDYGQFKSGEMKALYKELTETGAKSLENALKTGATIEDLDIRDLKLLISETSETSIITVYESLLKGSRNHMRSFISSMNRYGYRYNPIYITPKEFEEIITSPMERGN